MTYLNIPSGDAPIKGSDPSFTQSKSNFDPDGSEGMGLDNASKGNIPGEKKKRKDGWDLLIDGEEEVVVQKEEVEKVIKEESVLGEEKVIAVVVVVVVVVEEKGKKRRREKEKKRRRRSDVRRRNDMINEEASETNTKLHVRNYEKFEELR